MTDTYLLDRDRRDAPVAEAGIRHQVTAVDGVRIHSVIAGNGPLVVLLHGFPQNWREWRHVLPDLVTAGYTVLAPDLRGFGGSDKPLDGYDVRSVATDMSRLVTALGFDAADVVGHDTGSSTAYAWAAVRPEQVRTVTLTEAIPAGLGAAGAPAGPTLHDKPMWHYGFLSTPDLPEALIPGRERELLTYFFRAAAHDPTTFTDHDIDAYAAALASLGALRGALAHHRARDTSLAQNREFARNPLTMPVLAIGARQSFGARVGDAARQFATTVTTAVVDRCGHWVPEERPVWLTRTLLDFLGGRPGSADAGLS
ncbi:alpha/beta fold hydrolase [Amycolatopsis saalfeldensis]|uniref:Pimeloyl-ACP methyl ester carboxylesterase n=1 Tax=Amycolatopsis saalfeldensis TaxID=394193 RepID=A0A1H8X2M4_9PSEU|nr:alpha/beta hydrolase [Amycolatopsis saalfeldensis]SEP34091.1 Pimeloyl-ACP methyl ester carboxylesterase [Amycolatopsis saalfeldensis]